MMTARSTPELNKFNEGEYDGEWLQIGRFLRTMTPDVAWTREEANRIRKNAYRFFLQTEVYGSSQRIEAAFHSYKLI